MENAFRTDRVVSFAKRRRTAHDKHFIIVCAQCRTAVTPGDTFYTAATTEAGHTVELAWHATCTPGHVKNAVGI